MSINRSLHRIAQEGVIQTLEEKDKEIERLANIIKEVREYIKEMNVWCIEFENFGVGSKELLEILDKGSDEISK